MAFSLNQSSRPGSRRMSAGFSDINVTPFVDVMLVLLVVFMITAPMLTVGVPVDLPKTKAAKMNDQVEPVVISVDAMGNSYLQETQLSGEALIQRLLAVTLNNPDARIYVRGDSKLAYGRVMEVMGEIASAGFTKVSLIAEMPKSAPVPKGAAGLKKNGHPGVAPVGQVHNQQPVVQQPGQQGLPTLQQLVPQPGVAPAHQHPGNRAMMPQHQQQVPNQRPVNPQARPINAQQPARAAVPARAVAAQPAARVPAVAHPNGAASRGAPRAQGSRPTGTLGNPTQQGQPGAVYRG